MDCSGLCIAVVVVGLVLRGHEVFISSRCTGAAAPGVAAGAAWRGTHFCPFTCDSTFAKILPHAQHCDEIVVSELPGSHPQSFFPAFGVAQILRDRFFLISQSLLRSLEIGYMIQEGVA